MDAIMAVKVNGRIANAPRVQDILTRYGCSIKTRIGFHEASEDKCATDGILVLQLTGPSSETDLLFSELGAVDGVTAKMIEF